jgi:hypothetical protein
MARVLRKGSILKGRGGVVRSVLLLGILFICVAAGLLGALVRGRVRGSADRPDDLGGVPARMTPQVPSQPGGGIPPAPVEPAPELPAVSTVAPPVPIGAAARSRLTNSGSARFGPANTRAPQAKRAASMRAAGTSASW